MPHRALPEHLSGTLEAVRSLLGAAAASVAGLDEAQETLTFLGAVGAGAEHVVGMQVPVGHGIAGWAISSGQAIVVGDVPSEPRFARDVAERTGYVPTTILALPLEHLGQPLGVLEVLDADDAAGIDMATLSALCAPLALALHLPVGRGNDDPIAARVARLGPAERQLLLALLDYVERR